MARHRSTPKFYGKRIREIRGKYFWLRRKLGREKKLRAIKKIGNKEKRIADLLPALKGKASLATFCKKMKKLSKKLRIKHAEILLSAV